MMDASRSRALSILILVFLTLGLVGALTGDPAAAARRRLVRRVHIPYQGPALAVLAPGALLAYCIPGETPGCFDVPLKATDRYLTVGVEDASGQAAYGIVFDEEGAEIGDFCGSTERPIPSPGGSSITIWLFAGHCYGTTTPSVVTTGTIKLLFSNRL